MRICILASENYRNEILQRTIPAGTEIIWKTELNELVPGQAEVYIDLLFKPAPGRIQALKDLLPATVFINSVTHTTTDTDASFIRINGWPGFLNRNICETATSGELFQEPVKKAMESLGWGYKIVPDLPGMIAPRVIAMIINEAYFALGEQVSTKAEIDTAMKLGTNYPFGPFEWAEKIGLDNIRELLAVMSQTDERYRAAEMLNAEAVH